MEKQTVSTELISEEAIKILQKSGQWDQNETKISVSNFFIGNCSVYLVEFNVISSTMLISQNWSRQLLNMTKQPTVFAFRADSQRMGRGQKQNTWQSPEGNLYLTLLIKLEIFYFGYLPLISINNIYRTIDSYLKESKSESRAKIKWINDTLIDFEKVSGALIKCSAEGNRLYAEIGIGVNIKKNPQNVQQLNQGATFLQNHTSQEIPVAQFNRKIIQSFVQTLCIDDFNLAKNNAKAGYQQNLTYLNKQVVIYDYKFEKILGEGVFEGINQFGHAMIKGIDKPFVEGRMKAQIKVI